MVCDAGGARGGTELSSVPGLGRAGRADLGLHISTYLPRISTNTELQHFAMCPQRLMNSVEAVDGASVSDNHYNQFYHCPSPLEIVRFQ